MQCLVSTTDESELPSQGNSFCLVIKETCRLALSWWKIMRFLLTNSGRFSSSAAFSGSNWEQYLSELFGFPEGAHIIEDSHIHNITFPGWRPAFGVVGGGSFQLPRSLFLSILLYSIHFHRLSQFVLKTECFHYVSVENRMWKYGQEGFFRLTYVEPKHQSD